MKKFLLALATLFGLAGPALAQSGCPAITTGAVLTAAQWQSCFTAKQNVIPYTPVNKAGDTMLGRLTLPSATTLSASLNIPHGAAPISPNNGDVWTTSAGMFVRINGSTVGPLVGPGGTSFAGTAPISVTSPGGVVTYALTGIVPRANGGFGIDVSASTGVALWAAGTPTFTATTGTGSFVRAGSPTITGDWTFAGNLLQPTNAYHNWGSTIGTSGYGIRDNGGTMQVKNSGGSWSNIPTSGVTQWTTAGSNIYYNTGSVGVGTTSPSAALHVVSPSAGQAAIFGNNLGQNYITVQSASGIGLFGTYTNYPAILRNSGVDYAYYYDTNNNYSVLAGSVGIGTTAPAAVLHVSNATTATLRLEGGNTTAQIDAFSVGFNALSRIETTRFGSNTTGKLAFYTASSGTLRKHLVLTDAGELTLNADFTPGTDITSALQSALVAYKTVRLPCGRFFLTQTVGFGLPGQRLQGCGRGETILQLANAFDGWLMIVNGLADTSLLDLTLDLANLNQDGGCIIAEGLALRTVWQRVGCIRMSNGSIGGALQSNGFMFTGGNDPNNAPTWSALRDCYLEDMVANDSNFNSHAIAMNDSNYVTISGCTSKNIDNAVNTQASNWVTISNNVFYGTGASTTGFAGIRCGNGSLGVTVTGNVVRDMPRGLFPLGCSNSTFTGNSLTNCQYQCILVSATTGNASPTLDITIVGNAIQDTCLANTCTFAIELNSSGGGLQQNTAVVGNSYRRNATPPSAAMVGISGGVAGGANVCANNAANISVGGC